MAYDPLDLRGQDKQREAAALTLRVAQESEESDVKWLMSSKRGRRMVWRWLDQAGVFRISFAPNALQMAFAEGNRNSGNRLLAAIHSQCPENYAVMVKEQTNNGRLSDDGGRNEN